MEHIHKTTVIPSFWWFSFPPRARSLLILILQINTGGLSPFSLYMWGESAKKYRYVPLYRIYKYSAFMLWIFQTRYEGIDKICIFNGPALFLMQPICKPGKTRKRWNISKKRRYTQSQIMKNKIESVWPSPQYIWFKAH